MDGQHQRYSLSKLIEEIVFAIAVFATVFILIAYSAGDLGVYGNILGLLGIVALGYFIARKMEKYFFNKQGPEVSDLSDYEDIPVNISVDYMSPLTFLVMIAAMIGYAMACIGLAGAFGINGNLTYLVLSAISAPILWWSYRWLEPRYGPLNKYLFFGILALIGSAWADIDMKQPSPNTHSEAGDISPPKIDE